MASRRVHWFPRNRAALDAAAPGLAIALAAGLLLVRLAPDVGSKPIFEDESLAGLVSAHDPADVLAGVYDRGGAPLHFLLASVALRIDPSPAALRWLSVVFALAAVPLCYDLGRRLDGATAGAVSALTAASSQLLGIYGSFGRMYALLVFSAALALDLFVRALHTQTRRACLAAAAGALLLPAVHPFGAVLLAAEAVVGVAVWRGRHLRRAVPVLLAALVAVPFLLIDLRLAGRFSAGAGGGESIVSPRRAIAVLVRSLGGFAGGREPVFLLFFTLALIGAVGLWRRGERAFVALTVLALLALPALLVLARSSQGFSDHFSSRQLIFALPLWTALIGAGFAWATQALAPGLRTLLAVGLVVVALLAPPAVADPRSLQSGTVGALAAPAAWLDAEIVPNAVLFPSSPVFLAALPAARHARALSREQPVLVLRAIRRATLPVPAVFVAVPLDGVQLRPAMLRQALGSGYRVRVFPSWLVLEARGPFADRRRVLDRIATALAAVRPSLARGSPRLDGYLRQSRSAVCGAIRSLGGHCPPAGWSVLRSRGAVANVGVREADPPGRRCASPGWCSGHRGDRRAAASAAARRAWIADGRVRDHGRADSGSPPPPIPTPARVPGIVWPTYGYSANHVRVGPGTHSPPYRRVWLFRARALLEFPPAIAYGRLYVANAHGTLFAVEAKTGKLAWKRESGRCQASSPAVDRHLVYVTFLRTCDGKRHEDDGLIVAFAADTGKVRWQRRIGQSESSPFVSGGRVYVGDWTGAVYAFSAGTGKLIWRFTSDDKVKSAVAVSGNRLFFGSYDHHLYSLNARTGKLIWAAAAQDRGFRSRGSFYSGPAVAYGRVYIGSTDGKVYSFGAASGEIRWVTGTGGWVYSSPAVWEKRVYAGSYSKQLFCFDAATGAVEWTFSANGKISGSPTIIDGIVYFATLSGRTYGLDAKTGKQLWTFPDGEYTPVVSDAERLYLVGRARLYALEAPGQSPSAARSTDASTRGHRSAGVARPQAIRTASD